MPFTQYLKELRKHLRLGDATEHTHRPALKTLLEQTGEGITATNEPKHITDVGAPDFIVRRGAAPLGYIECKDIGANLDEIERTDQLKRYLAAFPKLIPPTTPVRAAANLWLPIGPLLLHPSNRQSGPSGPWCWVSYPWFSARLPHRLRYGPASHQDASVKTTGWRQQGLCWASSAA